MKQLEQDFFIMKCKLCGKVKDRWGNEWLEERKFVTNAQDPNKVVCTHCGFSSRHTDKELRKLLRGNVKGGYSTK